MLSWLVIPGSSVLDSCMCGVEGSLSSVAVGMHILEEAAVICSARLGEFSVCQVLSSASVGSPAEWAWDSTGQEAASKSSKPKVLARTLQPICHVTLGK